MRVTGVVSLSSLQLWGAIGTYTTTPAHGCRPVLMSLLFSAADRILAVLRSSLRRESSLP